MAGTDAATAGTALCCHGKRGACRFEGPRGGGCKWGEACFFCHVCTGVTTYSRIQKVLFSRRQQTAESAEASTSSSSNSSTHAVVGTGSSKRPASFSLLRLVGACPELLFEGPLGEALPPESLCIMPCASAAVATLVGSSGSLLLWRMQLRRLTSNGAFSMADALVESLSVGELRRATRALSELKAKSHWPIGTIADLEATIQAAEGAKRCISDGTVFALTCRYSASGRYGHGGLPFVRQGTPAFNELPPDGQDASTGEDDDHAVPPGPADEGAREDRPDDSPVAATGSEPAEGPLVDQNEVTAELGSDAPLEELPVEDHADDEDLVQEDEEPEAGGVWASQLAFPEFDGDAIRAPDDWHFRVAPVVVCTRGRRGEAVVVHRVLKPIILGGGSEVVRTVRHEVSLWSASPSVCAFEDLGLLEERPLSAAEASALLAGRPLRVVAAVRCLQRFWDLSLA